MINNMPANGTSSINLQYNVKKVNPFISSRNLLILAKMNVHLCKIDPNAQVYPTAEIKAKLLPIFKAVPVE